MAMESARFLCEKMSRLDPSLHPELTRSVIDKLFKRKIYTVLSFVDANPELLFKIMGIQFGKVLTIRRAILTKFSSTLLNGYQSYIQYINECSTITTGINCFDQLLGGGLTTGNIYELCGTSSSGKTQILMTTAVNVTHLLEHESVLYIDTKNDIQGHRLMEIIENNERNVENLGEFMDKIKICKIFKSNHLLNFLQQFSREKSKFRLLIIDSVPPLYFPFLKDEKNRGFVFLNYLANLLRFIAVEHKMIILVTNLLSVWSGENRGQKSVNHNTPFMGKYWYRVPNTRINVEKFDNCGKRTMTVTKSSDCPVGKWTEFKITKGGVE